MTEVMCLLIRYRHHLGTTSLLQTGLWRWLESSLHSLDSNDWLWYCRIAAQIPRMAW